MTKRLIVALTGAITLFWLCAAGLGLLVMQDELSEIFDSSLQETAERLLPLVVDDLQDDQPGTPHHLDLQTLDEEEYLIYQVRDSKGSVLIHSHDAPSKPFAVPLKPGFFDTAKQRYYTASTRDGSTYIQVADSFDHRSEATAEGALALFLPLLALVPVSVSIVWFVVRRQLNPLQHLRASIATKDGGNLAPIGQESLPVELHPIAHSVNLLLDRLRAALDAEREFTSNSAHELRTPIAGALAQTQLLAAEVPERYKARVSQIEHSLTHLSRLSEKLLQLSRAEAGIGIAEIGTDLLDVLDFVVEDIRRSPLGKGRIALDSGETISLVRNIDADAFAIVIRNLLENALLHGEKGGRVEIRVEPQGAITVRNHGPVLETAFLTDMTSRFTRGPTTAPGSGLGLSIVKRLAEQMQGTLEFQSPAPGWTDGLAVILTL